MQIALVIGAAQKRWKERKKNQNANSETPQEGAGSRLKNNGMKGGGAPSVQPLVGEELNSEMNGKYKEEPVGPVGME